MRAGHDDVEELPVRPTELVGALYFVPPGNFQTLLKVLRIRRNVSNEQALASALEIGGRGNAAQNAEEIVHFLNDGPALVERRDHVVIAAAYVYIVGIFAGVQRAVHNLQQRPLGGAQPQRNKTKSLETVVVSHYCLIV